MTGFARSHRLLLEDIKNFSIIFKILWQWKIEGCLFADFAAYHLEGLLISRAKFSEKVSNEKWEDENNLWIFAKSGGF